MSTIQPIQFIVHDLNQPSRLDRILRTTYPTWGRQAVQQMINQRKVQVNDQTIWLASWQVHNGDRVSISASPPGKSPVHDHFNLAWLLANAGEIIAVNKPAGLLSEPTRWGTGNNLRDLAISHSVKCCSFIVLIVTHRVWYCSHDRGQ